MATTAWKYPASDGQIDDEWTNPQNAYSDNGLYTAVGAVTPLIQQDWYNFGFTSADIPAGSIIDGIEVEIEALNNGAEIAWSITAYVVKDGVKTGGPQSEAWDEGSWTAKILGAPSVLWGATWTQADILDTNFGVWLDQTADPISGSFRMDYIRIRVTYHAGTTEHTSTCTIGVSPVTPMQFSLAALFSATIGLTPSCRTWVDSPYSVALTPTSGSEVFTPNEDLTPLEWVAYDDEGQETSVHYTSVDGDPAAVVYSAETENITTDGAATDAQDKFGFSAPTAPTGSVYNALTVNISAGVAQISGGSVTNRLQFTLYAGGNTLGVVTVNPTAWYDDPAVFSVTLSGLSVSLADMASLQLMIEPAIPSAYIEYYVYAIQILGYWEVTPTGIESKSITSKDDRTMTIRSADDRSISISSK